LIACWNSGMGGLFHSLNVSTRADTNIYLMHTANLILWGEALGNDRGPKASAAKEAGYEFWRAWLDYTRHTAGLHEFDSPTYTAVQVLFFCPVVCGVQRRK